MTGEQFIGERRTEAKEIIVNLLKRQFEEQSVRQLIKDPRTIYRDREKLIT